jgi:hypothetical protein
VGSCKRRTTASASTTPILQRPGAVPALELDINSECVTFNFYGSWGAGASQKLLAGMTRDATRYLTPDDRDSSRSTLAGVANGAARFCSLSARRP